MCLLFKGALKDHGLCLATSCDMIMTLTNKPTNHNQIWRPHSVPTSLVVQDQFTPEKFESNFKAASKIYDDMCNKFATRNKDLFSPDVMANWASWLEREKAKWHPHGKGHPKHTNVLKIPVPFSL